MKETSSSKRTAAGNKSGSASKTKSSTSTRGKTTAKASGKRTGSRTAVKAVEEKRKYFYQELIGLALLGLGIFSFISMVSGSVGILGESIKEILIAILGVMAYIFPFIFMLMGTALIIRRPWLFSNKKTYGILLVVLVTAMLLSLNRMEAVHREGFMVTLKNLMNINDINHGGILGLSLAVPFYRLLGPLGTYIIAGCLYVVAIILVFNTTIYDMLKKSNQARIEAKDKIAVKREEVQAQKELKKDTPEEKKIQDKLKILEMMNQNEEVHEESEQPEVTQSPFINLDLEENDGLERVLSKEDEVSREIQILGRNAQGAPTDPEKSKSTENNAPVQEQRSAKAEEKPRITEEKRKAANEDSGEIEGSQIGLDELEKPLYEFPEIALLKQNIKGMLANEDRNEIIENAKKLEETLMSFGVEARVINVSKGPSVTRYELQPKAGVKVSRIVNLSDDIALALAARGVRIEAPIPGKAAVGIEIPNKETTPVYLREVIEDPKFQRSTKKISVALGKDISGEAIIGDLSKMPHVLIAGATGSGKSVCINSLIISILYKYDPEHVRLLMVDPKVVELNVYNGIPHLLIPVVTDPKKAAGALNWAVNEMTRRYQSFAEHGVRNIEGFNEIAKKKKELQSLPYIVIIVDELADLMMVSANEVEDYIARLAQMARAAGMHLVIATQRPSVDVITGVIKANIPSRISFAVSSAIDSRTILDSGGAEKLLGKGDMLYYPVGEQKPKRIQGAFISEEEVEAIVSRIKVHKDKLSYDEDIINHIEKGKGDSDQSDEGDELYRDAVKVVVENQQASTSFLQRKMRIGYNRAARIMDELEDRGVISERDGSKPRQVLLNEFDLEE
ncbi:DNA translocase FtsK 4TM domain-containing protein [Proteiniclasticum sp. C24MP]|uniref:FtsK/SpoIIIE family DNA translocase n=1 Tax=Proteiniclasticum sp. C24MP TaxID=3374101 RepID=UPI0037541CFF